MLLVLILVASILSPSPDSFLDEHGDDAVLYGVAVFEQSVVPFELIVKNEGEKIPDKIMLNLDYPEKNFEVINARYQLDVSISELYGFETVDGIIKIEVMSTTTETPNYILLESINGYKINAQYVPIQEFSGGGSADSSFLKLMRIMLIGFLFLVLGFTVGTLIKKYSIWRRKNGQKSD